MSSLIRHKPHLGINGNPYADIFIEGSGVVATAFGPQGAAYQTTGMACAVSSAHKHASNMYLP